MYQISGFKPDSSEITPLRCIVYVTTVRVVCDVVIGYCLFVFVVGVLPTEEKECRII
jgi:hypothetical protein